EAGHGLQPERLRWPGPGHGDLPDRGRGSRRVARRDRCAVEAELDDPRPGDVSRIVHHGDGIAFLQKALPADHAIVTSLPDHSELPALGVAGWKAWFVDTVALACRAVADDSVAMFYQTDVK